MNNREVPVLSQRAEPIGSTNMWQTYPNGHERLHIAGSAAITLVPQGGSEQFSVHINTGNPADINEPGSTVAIAQGRRRARYEGLVALRAILRQALSQTEELCDAAEEELLLASAGLAPTRRSEAG